jgi:ABC-type transporter Mla MlaB component
MHQLTLNLSEVAYLSSAGIRVLVKFYKQLQGIQGSFIVSNPSEPVKTVLELAGLHTLLLAGAISSPALLSTTERVRRLERGNATFEIFEYTPGALLTCRAIGNPDLLLGCRFGEEHCQTLSFPEAEFAVGLGAFGNGFADCRSRSRSLFANRRHERSGLPGGGGDIRARLGSALLSGL